MSEPIRKFFTNCMVEHQRYFPLMPVKDQKTGKRKLDKNGFPSKEMKPGIVNVSRMFVDNVTGFGPHALFISYRPTYAIKQVYPDYGPEKPARTLLSENFTVRSYRPNKKAMVKVCWAACPAGVTPYWSMIDLGPTRAEIIKILDADAKGKNITLQSLRTEVVIENRFTNKRDFANWLKCHTGSFKESVSAIEEFTGNGW